MKRIPPKKFYLYVAVLCVFAVAGTLFYYISMPLYLLWYLSLTFVAFGLFGFDKMQAKRENAGRVPEITLHGVALAGGFLGILAGRSFFRHKTQKPVFLVIPLLGLFLHAGTVLWYVFKF